MLNFKLKALLSKIVDVFNVTVEDKQLTVMLRSEADAETVERWLEFGKFGSTPVICRGPKLERHQYWIVSSEASPKTIIDLQKSLCGA